MNNKKLNTIRRSIIAILNITKFVAIIFGIFGIFFFSCGLDSTGKAYDIFIRGLITSICMIGYASLSEIFVVMILLKKTEHLRVLFEFNFYPDNVEPLIETIRDEDELEDEDEENEECDTYMYHYGEGV